MSTIYLTPHCHYDVIWAFNEEDYLFINISIFNKAIKMIEETGFRFLVEQSYLLKMMERRAPDLYVNVEKAIKDGKIEIVDAQYIMADPMVPCGEVLIREILLGKRDCKRRFGVDVPVAWAADGFGLNAQMPQIYRKSGYNWLAFRRGLPRFVGERVSEFRWEGLDGTQILTHWMPLGYRAGLDLEQWESAVAYLKKTAVSSHLLMPCGSGGAIPQEEIPDRVTQWNQEHPDDEMILSTPSHFFENLSTEVSDFFVYQGELFSDELEDVFPDSVSSRARLKQAIRNRESGILTTERLAALAYLSGLPYPTETLGRMWRKNLFLANHDVIRGCGIDEIYEEPLSHIKTLEKEEAGIVRTSITHLLPGNTNGIFIAVFNPNNWPVRNWVESSVKPAGGWTVEPGISLDGEEIPSQPVETKRWDDGTISMTRIGFMADVPPLGCRVFELTRRAAVPEGDVQIESDEIETDFFKIHVDKNNGALSVRDLDGNSIVSGNEILIDEEIGDLYFHKSLLSRNIGAESGEGLHFGTFKPGRLSVHKGPVRTEIHFQTEFYCLRWPYYLIEKFSPILYRHKTVDVTKKVIVYNDIPRIDLEVQVNLLQPHVRIRLRFDTGMVAPVYNRQTQFGVLALSRDKTLRDTHRVPPLYWLAAEEGGRGLALLTHGIPVNEIKGGEVFCTLLRSVSVLSADGVSGPLIPTPGAEELGEHVYRYSILPYRGTWKDAKIFKHDFESRLPLLPLKLDKKPSVSTFESGIFLSPENLVLSAFKKTEDGDGLILRFFETKGESCKAALKVPERILAVQPVNLLETDDGPPLHIADGNVSFDVAPFEIVTLKLVFR